MRMPGAFVAAVLLACATPRSVDNGDEAAVIRRLLDLAAEFVAGKNGGPDSHR